MTMNRNDFQYAYQAYIDSLEWESEEPLTRDEWEKIIRAEHVDLASQDERVTMPTDDEIVWLIDWLDEDGYVTD